MLDKACNYIKHASESQHILCILCMSVLVFLCMVMVLVYKMWHFFNILVDKVLFCIKQVCVSQQWNLTMLALLDSQVWCHILFPNIHVVQASASVAWHIV